MLCLQTARYLIKALARVVSGGDVGAMLSYLKSVRGGGGGGSLTGGVLFGHVKGQQTSQGAVGHACDVVAHACRVGALCACCGLCRGVGCRDMYMQFDPSARATVASADECATNTAFFLAAFQFRANALVRRAASQLEASRRCVLRVACARVCASSRHCPCSSTVACVSSACTTGAN